MFKRKSSPALTYISRTCEIQGDVLAEGVLRVDGIIHGRVEVKGDIEIFSTGLIEGPEVRGHNIMVQGVLKARIFAAGKLILSSTARLEGDVVAEALEIRDGAYYTGYMETRDSKQLPPSGPVPELYGTTELGSPEV